MGLKRVTEPLEPIGFWSYTSSDDTASRGRLSQLRLLLRDELQLKIGKSPKVHIFQDVAAIPHGTDWLREIHKALGSSSFFIPIVTPAFLQSEMCCQEVMRFRDREIALGRDDLIFPFHYISVDDLNPGRPGDCYDPKVLELLRTRQWIDFRSLRLRANEHADVAQKLDTFSDSLRAALRRTSGGAAPRLMPAPDESIQTSVSDFKSQDQMTASESFEYFFVIRPDVVRDIEAEAAEASFDQINIFEKQMLRLEISVGSTDSYNFLPPDELAPDKAEYRDRILRLIETREADNESGRNFAQICRQPGASYDEWRSRLTQYQHSIGSRSQIIQCLVSGGRAMLPLVCTAFSQMNKSDGHNSFGSGFNYTWLIEIELAKALARAKYFPALSFIADAILWQADEMNGGNDWGLNIVRIVQMFGVDRSISDKCFQQLIGVTGSDILKARRDR